MASAEEIARSLSALERKVIRHIDRRKGVVELAREANVSEVEAMRAAQFLANKGVVRIWAEEREAYVLTEKGGAYIGKPLPERRILNALKEGPKPFKELPVTEEELKGVLGLLKREGLVRIEGGRLHLTEKGENYVFPWEGKLDKLEELDADALSVLERRGLVKKERKRVWLVEPTELWRDVVKHVQEDVIERLTPEIIRSGTWKERPFRAYDVNSPLPSLHGGKRHPYAEFLLRVKEKMLAMGFEEIPRGEIVLPSFWNSEVLFMPQDHPASEIGAGDVYLVASPKRYGSIEEEIYERVKAVHERAWGYEWSDEAAKRLILRSHATALSALMLYLGPKIPGRYFTISRVYRPDKIDARHLPEFNQLDGIVLDKSLTFRHLLGVLKDMAKEFGVGEKVKFKPAYFPFTEPSVELFAKHPELGWMEVGGAGVFREELLEPFGIEVPVIAWGLGIDRMFMIALGITDIRQLFSRDLGWLRNAPKVWVV